MKQFLENLHANFLRIFTYELVILITSYTLFKNTDEENFKKAEILSLIISAISIFVAVIVTYLFSKLFAEKTLRVERKKEIDKLSLKITLLRRVSYHIRASSQFWKFNDINIKAIIDKQYPNLTYEDYRGYTISGKRNFTFEELSKIQAAIYGTDGQAYLALKGLEDGADNYSFYFNINPQNYSLQDVMRYKEYSNSFWYFLNNSDDSIVHFNNISLLHLTEIHQLYFKITGKKIEENNLKKQIKILFEDFEDNIFDKHFYFNSLNSDIFPKTFKNIFINLGIFVSILVVSIFLYILNLPDRLSQLLTLFLVCLFIANTIDLFILIFISIKSELKIDDIFKL